MAQTNERPLPVLLAALFLCGVALWRFGIVPLSNWMADEIRALELLQELLALGFWLYVVWGLLNHRRWAWWLAVMFDGVLAAGLIAAVVFFDHLRPRLPGGVDPDSLVTILMVGGALAVAVWLLLMLPQSRRVFRPQ